MLNKDKNSLDGLSPRMAFGLGAAGGVGLMFIIGFFILLIIMLGDGGIATGKKANVGANVPTNTAPPADNGAEEIVLQPVTDEDWIKGDQKAPVTVVEFSDTECPFCQRFHDTMNQLLVDYDGKVNWVYRHFPLTSLHPKAPKEAEALECAGDQGGNEKFWAYTDLLYQTTPSNNGLDAAQLPVMAQQVGLDVEEFNDCLSSGKFAAKVSNHTQQAIDAGGRGTPYSVVISGDQQIPVSGAASLTQMKSLVDSLTQ
ncbi:MAG: DsbA family protein [Candidatus Komeilibacteria bacterium]|nr:DsbA family protein [Candidatus Komeilibacteria bacterium]